jgi:hypothetical protein
MIDAIGRVRKRSTIGMVGRLAAGNPSMVPGALRERGEMS